MRRDARRLTRAGPDKALVAKALDLQSKFTHGQTAITMETMTFPRERAGAGEVTGTARDNARRTEESMRHELPAPPANRARGGSQAPASSTPAAVRRRDAP